MNIPTVYLYDAREGKHSLYLGEYTIAEGLDLIPPDSRLWIHHICADAVFAIPEHLAGPQNVNVVRQFVQQATSIIDFECSTEAGFVLSSHDDCECHFQCNDLRLCEEILRKAVPSDCANTLWICLLANRGKYVTICRDRGVTIYDTFDDYLASRNPTANPWMSLPLADYEGHMALPEIGQAKMLADLFEIELREHRPESVALFGCSGGNGFDRIDATFTKRVVGVDLNPEYIAAARNRFAASFDTPRSSPPVLNRYGHENA